MGDPKGFYRVKMEGKYGAKSVQNAMLEFKDLFIPDNMKLTHAKDFGSSTNLVLETSRLLTAWIAAGCACGAYEATVKYALQRK
jgi:glutaryl-CoA dehydrogenase